MTLGVDGHLHAHGGPGKSSLSMTKKNKKTHQWQIQGAVRACCGVVNTSSL